MTVDACDRRLSLILQDRVTSLYYTVYWLPIGGPAAQAGLLGPKVDGHLAPFLYSSREPSELSQWLCCDDSTINIVVVIIIIIIIIINIIKASPSLGKTDLQSNSDRLNVCKNASMSQICKMHQYCPISIGNITFLLS